MTLGGTTLGGSTLGGSGDTIDIVSGTAKASTTASGTSTGTVLVIGTAETQLSASSAVTSLQSVVATASAAATATGELTDAIGNNAPIVWQVTRDGTTVEDAAYDVDPVVQTANPFGNYGVAKIDDAGGAKFNEYGRGTRVDIGVSTNAGVTFSNQFTGYVVERRESEQGGADALEVEAYSFDQFLRRNTVSNDQTGNTITDALADIIQTDTPVSYVAGNVTVGDDQELTRSYQGETVENTLRDIAFKSNNEEFGVNDDLEFFFRPRETRHIERGIDDTQWFNYDIPELGKQAINEVEVWFNDGNESVVVDDGTDKLDLQDSLGLSDPGTQRAELQRPTLTDIDDAEDEGRKYLEFRNATLSGTVTTYGLYDAQPGDTIDITISSRGIDDEFVIAGTEYRWGRDETILTIIEKRGDIDGILSELNESVKREEMQGADRDAPSNRITTTNATAVVDVAVDADGNTPTGTRFVNDGRSALRDGWADKGYPAISNILVGDDGTNLSRSNTALENQTATESVSETLPDSTSAEYSASITQSGVREIGLETSDGTLIARAVFDEVVDLNGDVTVTLTVSNDASVSRGVLTNDGQTAVRDVLADNSPNIPDEYVYGDTGTAVSESDTSLGNEIVRVGLDEILIQDANAQSEWSGILGTIQDDVPLGINATGPAPLQACFTVEGEDQTNDQSAVAFTLGDYSGGVARGFESSNSPGDFLEWEFTTEYMIPEESVEVAVRDGADGGDSVGVTWFLDGNEIDSLPAGAGITRNWTEVGEGLYSGGSGWTNGDLAPGTHTLRVEFDESTASGQDYRVDVVAPYDGRYNFTFDNVNDGSGGYLDGPELFPDQIVRSLNTAATRRDVDQARFALSANDVSGNFYVEVANDGSTFTRFNNATSGTATFADLESGVDVNISLGRYGSRTTATPQQGYLAQRIDTWELYANPDAVFSDDIGTVLTRAIVAPNTITGNTVREAGLIGGGDLLTRHELAAFDVLANQRLASAESTTFTGDN